jgi:uncharacterized protein (DUF2252 family)
MSELPIAALPEQTHTLPVAERIARGHTLRDSCSRLSHGEWTAPAGRRDPIEILIEQGAHRLPELLPLRYSRMRATPFAFLRGSAAVMAADLATTPSTGLQVQAAGDCHCLNFGGFATAERRLAFDINDFDETAVAPWEWDVKRLAASFAVAGLDRFDVPTRSSLAAEVARSYRQTMAEMAEMPVLDAWYRALTLEDDATAAAAGITTHDLHKAGKALIHAVEIADVRHHGETVPRIVDVPPLVYHPPADEAASFHDDVAAMIPGYASSLTPERRILLARYRLADTAYKVVGVGAVGTLCGIMLMVSGNGEALYLQFKEATASVLEAHAGRSPYSHPGERVVRGQRLLQAAGDILLGFTTGPRGRPVYVRQLRDAKIKPQIEAMESKDMLRYAATCGSVLARAHSRSGDAVILSGYLGKNDEFDQAIAAFALTYAEQTRKDHSALANAIAAGRLPALPEAD